jgi:hypothetical protein
LVGKGLANTPVVVQLFSSHHLMAATDMHATIDDLLEAEFSVGSVPKLYNKDQLPLREC